MNTLLFCGCTEREKSLIFPLCKNSSYIHSGKDILVTVNHQNTPQWFIAEFEGIPRVMEGNGIAVMGHLLKERQFPSGKFPWIAIFSPDNTAAARSLAGTGAAAITCGTSPKETLSLASISDSQAVISLQRSLRTLSGEIIEPGDFSIQLTKKVDVFPLLSYCAIRLLSDMGEIKKMIF